MDFGLSPGRILDMISQDPSVSKSQQLTVDFYEFSFKCVELYFIDLSKMIGDVHEVLSLNRLFPKLNWSICNYNSYCIQGHLQFGITQCYIYLMNISYFINKCQMHCSDIIEHLH